MSPDGSCLGVGLDAPLTPVGRGPKDLRPPPGLPLPLKPPGLAPPPSGVPPLLAFLCRSSSVSYVFWICDFYVAFILIMPPVAAISSRYCAAEMVLVLYLLTIFGFLLALQLEHARTSPITVRRVAGSTLIVRRTTVEKIWGPSTFGVYVLQLPTTVLPRIRVGLRRPPSREPLSKGSPSADVCTDACPFGGHSTSPWPIGSTDQPGHRRSVAEISSRTSLCSSPMSM